MVKNGTGRKESLMTMVTALVLAVGTLIQAGSLHYTAPASWKARASNSSMRVAEFAVPRVAGDAEDGEVIIYFFGGSGGTVEANIERWVGQFKTASGGAVPAPQRMTSTVGALKVTAIDVSGTYVAEVRPGAGDRLNKPNFRMRAAVVETQKGPYFIKFTGPEKTVAQSLASGDFDRFVKSLRVDK
jgi:hypothetical protein